jgi:hypothetical protein
MIITINNQPLDFALEDEKTLGEVFGGLESWLESGGLSISAVEVDGETESAGALDAVFLRTVDTVSVVSIYTRKLERTSLESLKPALPAITRGLEDFALNMQTGHDAEAGRAIGAFADFAEQLLPLCGAEDAASLSKIIKEIYAAYESGDSVLTGDLCEYEAAPLLERILQNG